MTDFSLMKPNKCFAIRSNVCRLTSSEPGLGRTGAASGSMSVMAQVELLQLTSVSGSGRTVNRQWTAQQCALDMPAAY